MGCELSSCIFIEGSIDHHDMHSPTSSSRPKKLADTVPNLTSITNLNELEIDVSHFFFTDKIIGLGGFGLIREVVKQSGSDRGTVYALKSLSKASVIKRSTGPSAVLTELKALALLKDCNFVCNIQYAFQDSAFLYMVMDMARGGDMRYNLKVAPQNRFTESAARFYFSQVAIALERCHLLSILHRGE